MLNAIIYGLFSGLSLLLGAFLGLQLRLSQKAVAMFMAFGSGVLICAITFGLMEEAFKLGGFDGALSGFVVGGMVFLLADYLMHKSGAKKHKRVQHLAETKDSTGPLITMGAVLDGVPESIALGVALHEGAAAGLLMVAAIFLSNLPEGISSVPGLKSEGYSQRVIYLIWSAVALLLSGCVLASFLYLGDLPDHALSFIQAFAAGAILAMLANSMMPEAYEEGGFLITPMTIGGFAIAFIIARA